MGLLKTMAQSSRIARHGGFNGRKGTFPLVAVLALLGCHPPKPTGPYNQGAQAQPWCAFSGSVVGIPVEAGEVVAQIGDSCGFH